MRLRLHIPSALLGLALLLTGCTDPALDVTTDLEGSWRTSFHPQMIYETAECYGSLAPMASETWEIYWEVTAVNSREVDIQMTWYSSNYLVTDFSCGAATGVFLEYGPIDHIYGYVDGSHLILSHNFSGAGGTKVITADLRYFSRGLQGSFYLDTYFGAGGITQSVYAGGQGLELEKY